MFLHFDKLGHQQRTAVRLKKCKDAPRASEYNI